MRGEAGGRDAVADGREALARLHRFGGDDLVRAMSAILLADVPARIAAARAGVRAGDCAAVRLAAHSIRSSCAQFGAVAVSALSADAERAALAEELAVVPALLDDVERSFAAFRGWLERQLPVAAGDE